MERRQIGGMLRAGRLARGLSIAEAARLAEISPRYLDNLENNRRLPSIYTLGRLCSVLRLSADKVLGVHHSIQ